jgi:hypothetical protein
MTKAPQHEPNERIERDVRDHLGPLIGEQILHTLGKPRQLLQVQVRPLWADHYRANVLVGADLASARVAHSYFVVTDADGHITTSTPKLTKQY